MNDNERFQPEADVKRDQTGGSLGSAGKVAGGIGAVLLAVVAGIAKHGGQIGRGIGRNADDVGRGFARHGDDLGRGFGQQADDFGRGLGQRADDVGWGSGRWPNEGAPRAADEFGQFGRAPQIQPHGIFPEGEIAKPIGQAGAAERGGEGVSGSLIHAGSRIVREVTKQEQAQSDDDPNK